MTCIPLTYVQPDMYILWRDELVDCCAWQVSIVDVLQEAYPFANDAEVARMLTWISTAPANGSVTNNSKRLPAHHLRRLAHADREEIVSGCMTCVRRVCDLY